MFNTHKLNMFGGLAVASLLVVGGTAAVRESSHPAPAAARTAQTSACQEDDPCWDWRTMGNHSHGICVEGTDQVQWLENDGRITLTPGGRGCEDRPKGVRCDEGFHTVTDTTGLRLPVGWRFSCPEGRGIPNGETIWAQKLIRIGDSALDGSEARLRYVIAHEICHARAQEAHDQAEWTNNIPVKEMNADACAARAGFPKV